MGFSAKCKTAGTLGMLSCGTVAAQYRAMRLMCMLDAGMQVGVRAAAAGSEPHALA